MSENAKRYITWLIVISIVIYLAISWVTGKWFTDKTTLDCISYTITGVTIFSGLYVQWLWRFNPLEKTPKLKKNYVGTFISTYDNKSREAELKISQNLLKITVYQKTNESRSQSIVSGIYDDAGQKWLSFVYLNKPDAMVRDRSEIHYGVCNLLVDDPKSLTGQYFTDRNTKGDMNFTAK